MFEDDGLSMNGVLIQMEQIDEGSTLGIVKRSDDRLTHNLATLHIRRNENQDRRHITMELVSDLQLDMRAVGSHDIDNTVCILFKNTPGLVGL